MEDKVPSDAVSPPPPFPPMPASTARVGDRRTPYARRGCVRALRFVLLYFGSPIVLFWVVVAVQTHGLPHIVGSLARLDKAPWSSALDVALLVPLAAGCVWAVAAEIREDVEMSRRRKALPHTPFAVRAEERWRADLAAARSRGDRRAEMQALGNVGFWLVRQERHAEAEGYLLQGLTLAREQGDRFREGRDLADLAQVAEWAGDLDRAEALYRESLAVSGQITDEKIADEEVADVSAVLGEFLIVARGRRTEGRRLLEEAQRRYRGFGKWGRYRAKRMRTLLRKYRP